MVTRRICDGKISTVTLDTQNYQIIQGWSHKSNLGGCIIDQGSLKMEHLGECKKKFRLHPGTGCMSRARFLIHSLMEVLVNGDIASNELRRKKIKKFRLNSSSSVPHSCVCVFKQVVFHRRCLCPRLSLNCCHAGRAGREPLCSKVKSASPFLAPKHLSLTYFQRCQGSGVCPFGGNFLQTVAGTKERRRRDPCTKLVATTPS